jgi:hypothetical protein
MGSRGGRDRRGSAGSTRKACGSSLPCGEECRSIFRIFDPLALVQEANQVAARRFTSSVARGSRVSAEKFDAGHVARSNGVAEQYETG